MTGSRYDLVGDIGGTNARFALVAPGSNQLQSVGTLSCADFGNLDGAVNAYLKQTAAGGIRRASLAFACPVSGETVQMTNNPWIFGKADMQRALGFEQFTILNDFTAMALGVTLVSPEHLHAIGDGEGDEASTKLVIGPGTGLGVSALVPARSGWIPLTTEGGHVDFAPTNELEMAIQRELRERFGRVSVERLLSGEGLVNLYQAMAAIRKESVPTQNPEAITSLAMTGQDAFAEQVLRLFCEILGRVAGNAALTLGSFGGVYICGGMVPRFLDFFRASAFRAAFEDKGRMRSLMERIPVFVVSDPHTGLRGAAAALAIEYPGSGA